MRNHSLDYDLGYYYLVGGRPSIPDTILCAYSADFQQGYRDRECLRHAVEAYSFLIPRKTEYTASQFAQAIRIHSSHPRIQLIAQVVEASKLTFERNIAEATTAFREEPAS